MSEVMRYVGLVWEGRDPDAAAKASALSERLREDGGRWELVLSQPGLALWMARRHFRCYGAHRLGDTLGVVLGLVFDRSSPDRSSVSLGGALFDEKESEEILRSGGRRLVEAYWGRYIAFLYGPSSEGRPGAERKRVLRDPIGDIPCYRARVAGMDIYFSFLPDFVKLKAVRLTVNWEHLGVRVVTGNAWAEESALNEIEVVHPGECIEYSPAGVSREYYWQPLALAMRSPIEQLEAAALEVRATTRTCADAWASLHGAGLHILSGGLDSSIVLSCMAGAPSPSRLVCLNFRTRDPDSDERAYARLAAAHSGVELLEMERQPVLELKSVFGCTPTVGPVCVVMRGLEVQPLIDEVARQRGTTAVFSGDGGDTLFFRGWPQLAVIDYAHSRGLRPELVRLAAAAALPAQLSVGHLLWDALRYGVLRRPWNWVPDLPEHYRLVTAEVIEKFRRLDFLNPWNASVRNLPPGKLLHAFGVTRPSLFRDPLPGSDELDFINPLISQPIVEVCLRIPTYLHAAEGQDRAVARAAFAGDLPPEILQRTWKGAADRHLRDMLKSNFSLVRELLLEGGLVKAGILDRRRVEDVLSPASTQRLSHAAEVFIYVCVEAWLRHWSDGSQPARESSVGARLLLTEP